MTTVAVIGALNEEVALIAQSLEGVEHDRGASLDVFRGTLVTNAGPTVNVAATVGGMGLVNAAATAQRLIDAYHPDAVIFSGIAGNLNRDLHVNDVVLGGTLRYLDTDMRLVGQWKPGTEDAPVEEFHSDPHLLALADAALNDAGIHHITGIIASGNYFVDTPEKVSEVTLATGADAVEMEGAAVAHVAARNDVPALVIRALSDNADTDYEVFKEFDISEYANTAARLVTDILRRM
ncbi:5'-methylthioadenosine/S-adenosylhomocysteine nucleosidase [Bifidobacterium avesanii]|uniref:adenosylhomocysteine nucleosidase n=1 Tax=Bifidobacterium avesanii TaxID=1798157 RepID=A0A7K3TKB8_9BIFI|nr:5'-methylthioadenosine/S-adenosylhomocysteine nucleosidase [Bifidobacterium avesanii]KAB8289726.1 5'-methylthioadenosine nucleosidase [Bifidobacterium avesanii]NEG79114.1 5'-methylthioadenosine/S-adenosylhomocysteine nucleosidase [Bifidobacterium avesanii]